MPPKGQADLAHPGAADWVLGNLAAAEAGEFQRHLTGCPYCQAAVAEFGQLGQMLQHLPPAAEPPAGLEARTLAGVIAAEGRGGGGMAKVIPFPRWPGRAAEPRR